MQRVNQELRRFRPAVDTLEERALLSTFTVSNLADDGGGSLRRAVALSNLTPGPDTINFAPGLQGEIHLTSGQLDLTDGVAINGPGSNRLAVSGNTSRIFETHSITATIQGLTLENGTAGAGGAIMQNQGALFLKRDNFVHNSAVFGGAVFDAYGNLEIQDSTFTGNTAIYGGAVFDSGTMRIQASTFTANNATGGGGAVQMAPLISSLPIGPASISFSTFIGNQGGNDGGAVANSFGSNLNVFHTVFLSNSTFDDGGALFNDPTSTATVTGSTFLNNSAGDAGGGIFSQHNLVLTNSTLQFNTASSGGAIQATNGTLTSLLNTIQFNSAPEVVLA